MFFQHNVFAIAFRRISVPGDLSKRSRVYDEKRLCLGDWLSSSSSSVCGGVNEAVSASVGCSIADAVSVTGWIAVEEPGAEATVADVVLAVGRSAVAGEEKAEALVTCVFDVAGAARGDAKTEMVAEGEVFGRLKAKNLGGDR